MHFAYILKLLWSRYEGHGPWLGGALAGAAINLLVIPADGQLILNQVETARAIRLGNAALFTALAILPLLFRLKWKIYSDYLLFIPVLTMSASLSFLETLSERQSYYNGLAQMYFFLVIFRSRLPVAILLHSAPALTYFLIAGPDLFDVVRIELQLYAGLSFTAGRLLIVMDAAQRNRTRLETAVLWLRKSAHELQAPLLTIRNLAAGGAIRGPQRERLQKIAAAAEDGLILYERMLLNTRYKRATVEAPDLLSLEDCLHEALRTAGVGLPAPEIRLRVQDYPVRCSRPFLVNAIRNVVRNGIEAIARAGKGDLHIWTEVDSRGCTLVIRDTGEGMTEAVRRKVFRPGFTGAHGFGFGLAFTRATLEGLGGEATCRAAPGQYSEFRLWFPQSR